jgi:hypothetical protein
MARSQRARPPAGLMTGSATKQSRLVPRKDSGLLRCARNDGARGIGVAFTTRTSLAGTSLVDISLADTASRSRGWFCPSFARRPRPPLEEGAGKAGSPLLPWPPVRQNACAFSTGGEPQGSRDIPAFPARWLYGLYRALPGERCTLAPVTLRKIARLGAQPFGRQDHTILPYAAPVVHARQESRATQPRPPPPGPRVVTIAIRPSSLGRVADSIRQTRNSVNTNIFAKAA